VSPGPGSEPADSSGSSGENVDAAKWILTQNFLTDENHIKWGALGIALVGSTVYSIMIGAIRGVLSIGEAFENALGGAATAVQTQARRFFDSFTRQLSDLWGVDVDFSLLETDFTIVKLDGLAGLGIDLGLFQLPANLVIVLMAFTILAWGVRQLAS